MAKAASKSSAKTASKTRTTAKTNAKTTASAGRKKSARTSSTTRRRTQDDEDDEDEGEDGGHLSDSDGDDDGASDAYEDNNEEDDGAESDVASLHSDALDDSDFDQPTSRGKKRKRGSAASSPNKKSAKTKASPVSKRRKSKAAEDEDEDEDLEDGQEVVGVVVQAPKTGRVPPGQISQNTFNFLKQLQDPECNDRTWFKLHEPVWRQAEKEWKDFLEQFTDLLCEADPEIPPLPPNDVLHRIYRDIRFSNDKTPYKTNLSASFSRSGRKGTFAHFKPGGGSIVAGGSWCPGKTELQQIRNHILHDPSRLREAISTEEFVRLFGAPKPHPKGKRQNIFGCEDELKNAPKGIAKDHRDIDLLKCRSHAVWHSISDEDVLAPDFKEKLIESINVLRPFVHLLNEMMTTPPGEDDEDGEE